MSVLDAAKAVAGETGLLSVPSTFIGNTDPGVVQLYYVMLRSAQALSQFNWQRLLREQTITTVDDQEGYSLPSDYLRYVSQTAWDATNYWPMRGSLDPQTWNALKRGIVTAPQTRREFRVRGNQVLIDPTPDTAGQTLIVEYARNTPWTDSTGATYRTAPTADTDLSLFPESVLVLETKWRLKKEKGMPYEEDFNEAEVARSTALAQDVPAMTLNFGLQLDKTPPFLVNVPQQIAT